MFKSNCGSPILCAFPSKCLYVMVMLLSTIPLVLADDTRADKILVRTLGNASNPLSLVNFTDVKYQYQTGDIEDVNRLFIEGALVPTSRLKIIYDLSYNQTDRSGEDEADFETLGISPVYFGFDGKLSEKWYFRSNFGFDWTYDFGHDDKGIGSGADTIGPRIGFGLANLESEVTAAAVLQHTQSYNGSSDIEATTLSITTVRQFRKAGWISSNVVIIRDWEYNAWRSSFSLQAGYGFGNGKAIYVNGMAGLGRDRLFDVGAGLGLRFNY
jgi:hypothetical protein